VGQKVAQVSRRIPANGPIQVDKSDLIVPAQHLSGIEVAVDSGIGDRHIQEPLGHILHKSPQTIAQTGTQEGYAVRDPLKRPNFILTL
jgi:hypothetical protein